MTQQACSCGAPAECRFLGASMCLGCVALTLRRIMLDIVGDRRRIEVRRARDTLGAIQDAARQFEEKTAKHA